MLAAKKFRITFVRHGETELNRLRKIQGQGVDACLNDTGRTQARALAKRLCNESFNLVYSSDLLRAKETCEIILTENIPGSTGIAAGIKDINLDLRIRERCYGIMEGQTSEDFEQLAKAAGVPRADFVPEGAETITDLGNRAESFFLSLSRHCFDMQVNQHADGDNISNVLVVAHGRLIVTLFGRLSEKYGCIFPPGKLSVVPKNTAISRFEVNLTKKYIDVLAGATAPSDGSMSKALKAMMQTKLHHLLLHPVEFVAASDDANATNAQDCKETSGSDARKIYEDIINEEPLAASCSSQSDNTVKAKQKKRHKRDQRLCTYKELYHAAQIGDLKTVQNCVCSKNLDINATDSFLWTPLMMAAYEGHAELVLYLLSKGALWTDKIDESGYDARDLACLGGHPEIFDLFTDSEKHVLKRNRLAAKKEAERRIKPEKVWCDSCKSYYFSSLRVDDSHATSTAHLVSDKNFPPKCHSHFYIPSSNKGFRLLRREGWDGESGLGPNKDGYKYPVKTVLKRDHSGIGSRSGSMKARVTHFASFDESAVASSTSKSSDKNKRRKCLHQESEDDRQREIKFRLLFH